MHPPMKKIDVRERAFSDTSANHHLSITFHLPIHNPYSIGVRYQERATKRNSHESREIRKDRRPGRGHARRHGTLCVEGDGVESRISAVSRAWTGQSRWAP